ncbi:hypothetical protein LCGC14_3033600, partial [marine sediment metagenome]
MYIKKVERGLIKSMMVDINDN